MFVEADKTRNMYEMDPATYNKLISDNITQKYKSADTSTVDDIENEFYSIANKLNISDRIEKNAKKPAYVTIKDHKENFEHKLPCRLINPTKSEIGRVSKQFLDHANNNIRTALRLNQWRNTNAVIDWFTNLKNKNALTFITFDIVEFYPSITEELLTKCIKWAQQYTHIGKIEQDTILHARRSLLFDTKGRAWVKKDQSNQFDVTMGANDGAEIAELVGLYVLHKLKNETRLENTGLYRDDGLAAIKTSASEADKVRKKLIQVLQPLGLKITVQTNMKQVNFLDINLDLTTGVYKPYKKPNDVPMYIHAESNHPPTIIKQIPKIIEKRISTLSSNKDVFEKNAPIYNEALKASGYNTSISFNKPNTKKRIRTRKVIWFNPPFSKNVKTNVGKTFLKLMDKHFPNDHTLHTIFNRHTVKVSYSCLPNVRTIIKSHNTKTIKKSVTPTKTAPTCNCHKKAECPLRGGCQVNSVIYSATVTANNHDKIYIGLAGDTFKSRYYNHTKSFRNEKYAKKQSCPSMYGH